MPTAVMACSNVLADGWSPLLWAPHAHAFATRSAAHPCTEPPGVRHPGVIQVCLDLGPGRRERRIRFIDRVMDNATLRVVLAGPNHKRNTRSSWANLRYPVRAARAATRMAMA
jgi:hypothetical protein